MISFLSILRRTLGLAGALFFLLGPAASAQQPQVFFFKLFDPDTIGPGSVSTLLFEIASSEDVPVSDLAFTDVLPAGVVIASPPNASTTCGAGAVLDAPAGGSTITLTGGQLPPTPPAEEGVSCLVLVDVTSATPGVHTNLSGDLTSSLGNHGDATADLTVTTDRPGFTKSFSPSPITVGQTSTLTFTIDNSANGSAAFNLAFTDNLPAGLTVADPANAATTCGGGLNATPGSSSVGLFSGFVAAGSSCTVTVDVLASAAGALGNTTGNLTSTLGSSGKAAAVLDVQLDALIKVFTDDPAPPGGTVTLRFTITNFDRTEAATGLAFTDDLEAALSGLVAVPPLPAAPCGPGSTLSGTSALSLAGGNLPAGGSCTFDVTLQVPAGAAPGVYTNTTSPLTATVGGVPVTLNSASDDLVVVAKPVLTKEFTDDPAIPGGTVTLEFTLTNTSSTSSATDIAFTDDLAAALSGLAAVALPASGFCGPGSTITGSTVLSVSGASLAPAGSPGDSCTFQVTLQVPSGAPGGAYSNTTSAVTATVDGETVTGDPASDDLVVVAAPHLQKEFTDDPVQPGATVTLQLTLTHPAEAPNDAIGIAFTDDLDAALSGLVATGLPLADPCGPGSQLEGDPDASSLSFTGGSLSPGESCTF
ncbi:MAG TPA: Ig domain-containing protein, partial [Thermoanaerobaculia bacterium]